MSVRAPDDRGPDRPRGGGASALRSVRRKDLPAGPGYKWVALSNTTLGVLIATMDASIVIISLPAIFRGIGLDPLAPGNIGYLLWMILGYLLVSAVLVVVLGRLGDMYGRVKIYNLGFLVFACASVALSLDPFRAAARRPVADPVARRAGVRRLHAHRQLGRHPHRRLPHPAAWHGPRDQPDHRAHRPVPRPPHAADCWPPSTGARCSG